VDFYYGGGHRVASQWTNLGMTSYTESRACFTDNAWSSYLNVRVNKRGEPIILFVAEQRQVASDLLLITMTRQDLARRIAALQRRNPNELIVLQVVCGDEALRDALWEKWADTRLPSGWFYGVSAEVVRVADNIARLQSEGRWLESRFTSALTP
jgi:hypothetical protein